MGGRYGRPSTWKLWASARFISIVTWCKPTAAPGTASITGSYVALHQALEMLVKHRVLPKVPSRSAVAAISVGLVKGGLMLDMCYEEDFQAQADFNVVLTDQGELVELQGATEAEPIPSSMGE